MSLDLPAHSRPPVSQRSPRPLDDASLFVNRELSWLEFNARVVAEAADERVPLYERVKFLSIFANNLDEFFMVRVAGLQAQLSGEIDEVPPDGMTPVQQLTAISIRTHELVDESYRIWADSVQPHLREAGIALILPDELATEDQALLDEHFRKDIFPVLTPIVVDPAHPFPHVRNKSINVGFVFDSPVRGTEPSFGVVQVLLGIARQRRDASCTLAVVDRRLVDQGSLLRAADHHGCFDADPDEAEPDAARPDPGQGDDGHADRVYVHVPLVSVWTGALLDDQQCPFDRPAVADHAPDRGWQAESQLILLLRSPPRLGAVGSASCACPELNSLGLPTF